MMARMAALTLLAAGLTGCGGLTTLYLQPGEKMNPNTSGAPAPVRIRIYQLKDDVKFTRADFEELWTNAAEVLKEDLLAEPREDDVQPRKPGDKADFKIAKTFKEEELKPETRYFGVAANFTPDQIRKEDQVKWKKVVLRDEVGNFVFVLDGYELKLVED